MKGSPIGSMPTPQALRRIEEEYGYTGPKAKFFLSVVRGERKSGVVSAAPNDLANTTIMINPFALVDLHLPGLHDQRSHGRRRRSLGATPFRGKPRGVPTSDSDPYYKTARYKNFQKNLDSKARELGVKIQGQDKASGIWEGSYEPALAVEVKGNPSDVHKLSSYLAGQYNQDAIMEWQPHSDGPDRYYTIHGVTPSAATGQALGKHGFPGGRFTDKGLEIADFDGENLDNALKLAGDLGGDITVTPGTVNFVEQPAAA